MRRTDDRELILCQNDKKNTCIAQLFRFIFVACIFGTFILWAYLLLRNPQGIQQGAFFNDHNDWFMDFYNTVYFGVGKTPYTWGYIPARTYLPIGYLLVYPFSFLYPYDVNNWGTAYASRYSQLPAIGGLLFMVVSIMFTFMLLYRMIRGKETEKLGILFAFLFSSVMLFNYDRGNGIIFVSGLVILYYILLDNKTSWKRQMGLICLALSIALKIFPAFFGIFLVFRKRYRDIALLALYTLALTLLPFLWLNGDLYLNLYAYVMALKAHAQVYANGNYGFNAPIAFLNITELFSIPQALYYIITIIAAALAFWQKKEWKRLLLIVLAYLLCSGQQGFYCFILLFVPVIMLLNEESHNKADWLFLVGFILILMPVRYDFFDGRLNNDRIINTVCILGFILLTVESLANIFSEKKRENTILKA